MRTTVYTNPSDPDETDEHPGCYGCVGDGGSLVIVQWPSDGIETEYGPSEWSSYDTTNDDL